MSKTWPDIRGLHEEDIVGKVRRLIIGTVVAGITLLPFAPAAHATVCNDNFPTPETGPTTCAVLGIIIDPICRHVCG